MNSGQMIFTQVMCVMPLKTFHRCVYRYQGNFSVKHFNCLEQFRVMAFAQMTYRESLRDTVTCLRSQNSKLYRMGIQSTVSKSTLADANEVRDWRIYADFAKHLIGIARKLYQKEPLVVDIEQTVYALIPQLLTCACPYSPGLTSAKPRPLSNCIRSLTSGGTYRHSFTYLMANSMTSMFWM